MGPATRERWENLIAKVAGILDQEGIPYHFDGSTAVYIQGIDFEMDDADVTVKWGYLERAREAFNRFQPSAITSANPPSFACHVDGLKVHVMTYESPTGLGAPSDRVQVSVAGLNVWAKTVDFYRRHIGPDHPLWHSLSSSRTVRKSP